MQIAESVYEPTNKHWSCVSMQPLGGISSSTYRRFLDDILRVDFSRLERARRLENGNAAATGMAVLSGHSSCAVAQYWEAPYKMELVRSDKRPDNWEYVLDAKGDRILAGDYYIGFVDPRTIDEAALYSRYRNSIGRKSSQPPLQWMSTNHLDPFYCESRAEPSVCTAVTDMHQISVPTDNACSAYADLPDVSLGKAWRDQRLEDR